jgi:two-component system response regulator HydG
MSRARLVVVHPRPSALASLASMLQNIRYEIVEASDGRAALRLLAQPPGLVLMGVDPGEPEALELVAYVRRKHPGVPILLLLSTWNPGLATQAVRMGAVAVLRYPVAAAELRAAVVQSLDAAKATRRDDGAPTPPAEPARREIRDEPEGPSDEPPEPPAMISEGGPCSCTCHAQPAGRDVGRFISGAMVVPAGVALRPLKEALEGPERAIIIRTLQACGWNRREAARSLEINRTTLYKKMKKYRLIEDEPVGTTAGP